MIALVHASIPIQNRAGAPLFTAYVPGRQTFFAVRVLFHLVLALASILTISLARALLNPVIAPALWISSAASAARRRRTSGALM
jgi:hypothetical protein